MHKRIVRLLDRSFVDVARKHFNGDDLQRVMFAHDMARYAHAGQTPRDSGKPVITHPERVAKITIGLNMRRPDITALALLHDIIEDCAFLSRADIARIRTVFDGDLIDDLYTLSKRSSSVHIEWTGSRMDYYHSLRHASQRVQIVKSCDRLDNLLDTAHVTSDKRERQRRTTRDHLVPMLQDMLRGMNRTDPMRYVVEYLFEEFERLCKG